MSSNGRFTSDVFKGFFFALAATILVSTNFVTAKYGLKGFNPVTFSLVWTSSAAVYALAAVLVAGYGRGLALPARAVKKVATMGLACGAAMILAWAGLARLDPSFASLLWRFLPLLAIVSGTLFLGERLSVRELAPVAIMILGGVVSTLGRWQIVGTGMVLTLLACCAGAVQMLMAKMTVTEVHPLVLVFYRCGLGALTVASWGILTGNLDFDVA